MSNYYGLGGRGTLRVREVYLRDVAAPLISASAAGALKLDLAVRALASSQSDGQLPPEVTWEFLHDLVRPGVYYGDERRLKRNWVGPKLEALADLHLLTRDPVPGRRSRIVVLRDDQSGKVMDDPGEVGDSYATVLGGLFEYRRLSDWGGPALAAYFAAMIAERYARNDPLNASWAAELPIGAGIWFRALTWFEDREGLRPDHHIRVGFSARTLRRGMSQLQQQGLLVSTRLPQDPRTGKTFASRYGRVFYRNGFDDLRTNRTTLPAWRFRQQLERFMEMNFAD